MRTKKLKRALSSWTSETVPVTENEISGSTIAIQQMMHTSSV
jgi:hypothetical protein